MQHYRRPPARFRWVGTVFAITMIAGGALVATGHDDSSKASAQPPVATTESVATPVFSVPSTTSTTTIAPETTIAPVSNPLVVAAGGTLLSPADCAKRVVKTSESRSGNSSANHTMGKATSATNGNWGRDARANSFMKRVDGHYTGTTDEIIQWAACKWGIDADQVRAQAMIESSWHQTSVAGFTPDTGNCVDATHRRPITSATTTTSTSTTTSTTIEPAETTTTTPTTTTATTPQFECPTAFGLLQLRADYQPGTYPMSAKSTAYNVDYALAMQRACIEGVSWLGAQTKGDVWGCVGAFYSGKWHDGAAEQYIAKVQSMLHAPSWPH